MCTQLQSPIETARTGPWGVVVSVLFSERPDASPTSRPRHVPRLIAESTSFREKEQVGGIDVFWATPKFARPRLLRNRALAGSNSVKADGAGAN